MAEVRSVRSWGPGPSGLFSRGRIVTLRNYLAELVFGLDWRGISRFTTGIPVRSTLPDEPFAPGRVLRVESAA